MQEQPIPHAHATEAAKGKARDLEIEAASRLPQEYCCGGMRTVEMRRRSTIEGQVGLLESGSGSLATRLLPARQTDETEKHVHLVRVGSSSNYKYTII